MVISDLKVTSAEISVSNINADSAYDIYATFRVVDGQVKAIYGGRVFSKESGEHIADFNMNIEFELVQSLNFKGSIIKDKEAKCEITALVDDFVELATAKAVEEAAE